MDGRKNEAAQSPLGIYIHVPFCAGKCPYCAFYSLPELSLADAYVKAVTEELSSLSRLSEFTGEEAKRRAVDTVYFGGGTPSLLGGDRLSAILSAVRENFTVLPDAEITVECNPSTPALPGLFSALNEAGVNRVSLGLQSAVDAERKKLGRRASAADAEKAVKDCIAAGIGNVSADLMLGIPGQTRESLQTSLDAVLGMGVSHIGAYMLQLEEGTFFYKKRDTLSLPSEDETAELYLFMSGYLREHGLRHYEISNFCFPGKASRHNTRYWLGADYLGFGPSAHSFYGGKRFFLPDSLEGFLNGEKAVYDGTGGDAEETVMLRLRLDEGISLKELSERFGLTPKPRFAKTVTDAEKHGLLNFDGDRLALTPAGFLISNTLIGVITDLFTY